MGETRKLYASGS